MRAIASSSSVNAGVAGAAGADAGGACAAAIDAAESMANKIAGIRAALMIIELFLAGTERIIGESLSSVIGGKK
jgi:hypothetical protein